MPETLGQLRQRLGSTPAGAGIRTDLLTDLINARIEDICHSRPWTRLNKTEGFLLLQAPYDTGTISINLGDTAGTGTGTVFTDMMTGWHFRPGNEIDWYYFTFVDATDFTIDRPFTGPSDFVNESFYLWQPVYELPSDVNELLSLQNPLLGGDLEERSYDWLESYAPSRLAYGPPAWWAPFQDSADGNAQIELYPGPDASYGLPMRYTAKPIRLVNSSDKFPNWFNSNCVYAGVLADLYRMADDQNRATAQEKQYLTLLGWMAQEDARRTPVSETHMADRYEQHRVERTLRRRGRAALRNWYPAQ